MSSCPQCGYVFLKHDMHCPQCHPLQQGGSTSTQQEQSFFAALCSLEGRETRLKYWVFYIENIILSIICVVIHPALWLLYFLVMIYPSIATTIRRAHDMNYSGHFVWLCLIPIIGLIPSLMLLFKRGTKGANRYGEEPVLFGSNTTTNDYYNTAASNDANSSDKAKTGVTTSHSQQDTSSHLNNQQLDKLFDENK